jgi:hypothetical protein
LTTSLYSSWSPPLAAVDADPADAALGDRDRDRNR